MNTQPDVICGTAEVERIAERIRRGRQQISFQRRLPIGAELLTEAEGAHVRVWAPASQSCAVEIFDSEGKAVIATVPLGAETPENGSQCAGYFSGVVPAANEGALYKIRLDSGSFPDPASRFQPFGPHGPSQMINPARYRWRDNQWRGVSREGQVIYELHVGTFTREGTWRSAISQLPELARLGITLLEVMPVADFPGRFGWGYDGVNMFAPTRLYGEPDDFRAFIDAAHEHGLGVILDVVYNHFGPDGNYVSSFSPFYFSNHYECEWGEAINFDGENSAPVREFFISNAGYWIDEFHLDGMRLDATQQIFDKSEHNVMAEIVERVRATARGRGTFIVAENEPQHTRLVRDQVQRGYGMDALWNDDFHHSAMVAATGRNEAYYTDYKGSPQEFISALKWGYLYQGQWYKWQENRRGSPALDLPPDHFVTFIQNHDQVANSLRGHRLHQLTSPGCYRALTALLLLGPNTPMLFQGQEFAASTPFLYFADHNAELSKLVAKGRKEFLHQFKSIACTECDQVLADPRAEETFRQCILDFSEREKNSPVYALHRDLLRLRKEDPVFARPRSRGIDGAVLNERAFVLRFFGDGLAALSPHLSGDSPNSGSYSFGSEDRLLLINLGLDLHLNPAPEPLLAPPRDHRWRVIFSTESVCYGGGGTPPVETDENWWLPGQAAVVVAPERLGE